jgi:putative peptidoglycan lipid II flippase
MKTPVKIGVIAMGSNMVLNLVFVVPLHSYWQIGHVGLALATSASAFINAGLLLRGLRREGVYTAKPGWVRFLLSLMAANVMMAGSLLWVLPMLGDISLLGWWERCVSVMMLCGAGLLVYVVMLVLAGIRPRDFRPAR